MLVLLYIVKEDKNVSNKYSNIKKSGNKIVEISTKPKVKICLNLNLKICLGLKTLAKIKMLILLENLTF